MPDTEFQAALEFLYSFADYSVERSYRYSADVFELDRVRRLLKDLGNPQDQYQSFHIAGTKGKGSVSALIASVLRANGYRTGLYTSPHLIRINERISIDGVPIKNRDFVTLTERLMGVVDAHPGLTVFELLTAMGFMYFADQAAECAVIEVGLGGRLDATNVITPLVSVITSISYDHMHLLGDTLSEIAGEKAGIIKAGIPVVLAPQQIEADIVVERVAEQKEAPLVRVGSDWLYSAGARSMQGQNVFIWPAREQSLMDAYVESGGSEEWAPPKYQIPLLGYHQVTNAAVAYAALQTGHDRGLKIREEAIRSGFQEVSWPGRFDILRLEPALIVDAAHNRDSALKLRIALDDYFPGQPVILIFGASADKDIEGMLTELLPRVSRLIVTRSEHQRAEDPEMIRNIGHAHGLSVEVISSVSSAVHRALNDARVDDVIVATGSIFIVGEVLATWDAISHRTQDQGALEVA